ncbi:MAG: D-alanine--D-alanine ligase [Chloroherpetonaceae bacterium]|nr:D-alanine--D-alanine ligase [Chthonomonadaceae bacterium]MDW8208444.1 D-alanine--D-alanine ligase [Chloroherpetonaceae bacterium]
MSGPRKIRVAVLMGGISREREVSLSTGRMVLSALDPERYEAIAIDTQDLTGPAALTGQAARALAEARPDVVWIALHGRGGEDGTVQGLLELMGVPYTGSGVLASALAMDKAMAKTLFRAAGVPVLKDLRLRRGEPLTGVHERVCAELGGYPVFVKPNAEGSTFGCTLVTAPATLESAIQTALTYDPLALVEPYVQGTEITVGVLGNTGTTLQALPVIEIVPRAAYYDYESKYAEGGSEHIIPARLPDTLLRRAQEIALVCHTLLGCRGMSRTDLIASGESLWVLETNTIPGMTPTSLLPQAAAHAGIAFSELLDRIISLALSGKREGGCGA